MLTWGGHSPSPFWCLCQKLSSVPCHTLIKLCYTKALEWPSLVPGPKAKSSLEITNLTPLTVSYYQHQGLFQWEKLALCISWPKYWSPFNEYPELISFRMDWFDVLAAQATLKRLLQHHNLKASIFRCLSFFMVQLSYPHMTTRKTTALTIWIFVSKLTSLPFNMLSRSVIAFLLRSKCLNFTTAVTGISIDLVVNKQILASV